MIRTVSDRARRVARLIAAIALVAAPGAAGAQSVLLRIRPTPGDTIHLRLDQQVVMTGRTRMGAHDSTRSTRTKTHLRARVIIERADPKWTTVLAITDSASVMQGIGRRESANEAVRRALHGKRLRLRVSPEGVSEVLENPDSLPEPFYGLFARIPATLPSEAVKVGESWTQDLQLPVSPAPGAGRPPSRLRTTFRLDSLSREGRIAYISLSATFARDSSERGDLPPGATLSAAGQLKGWLRIDRVRGWMTASWATITVSSVLTPPPGAADKPMRFNMQVTQHIRAIDKP